MKKLGVTLLATTPLPLPACGGGNDTTPLAGEDRDFRTPDESSRCTEDLAGGTIVMGEYVMLPSFSPGQGHYGLRGGAQSAAVFDRLMRWNPETAEFEPKLAESLEPNEDNTVWTLTLRDGVTFSNGDPLTADDVKFTMELHADPATASAAKTDVDEIESIRVVDPLTVEFELGEPWAGFPFALTRSAGEVIPRDAYTEMGPEEWAANPIGAGAYVMAGNTPGQEVVLEPNPGYYGGPVCPTLRFISIPGSQATLEAFRNDEVQVGYLRGAQFINDAMEDDAQGFLSVISSGRAIVMNNGVAGYDGVFTDERARKAVAHGLDRELINDRLTDGLGQPTSALIAESSRFYDGQQGPAYDPELAAELVDELKAEGDWNGDVTLLVNTSPENVETGVMIKAMLDAVGFNVTLENVPQSQQAARLFSHDYEMTIGGLNPSDADPSASLTAYVTPGGPTNNSGVDNPELTEAGRNLKTAATLDEQIAALNRFQEIHNQVMPFTIFANAEEFVVVDESVKGVAPTSSGVMLFDGAYTTER